MTGVRAGRRGEGRRAVPALVAAAAVILVLVVWFLAGGDEPTTGVVTGDRGAGHPSAETAPAFSATTLDGAQFTFPTGKPTVLFFMAGWCSDCLPEAEALDRIERDLGDRVAVLAVDADPTDPVQSLRGFADYVKARYGFAHDPDGRLTGLFQVKALDTTVITDAGGRIVFRDVVPTKEAALRAALARAGAA